MTIEVRGDSIIQWWPLGETKLPGHTVVFGHFGTLLKSFAKEIPVETRERLQERFKTHRWYGADGKVVDEIAAALGQAFAAARGILPHLQGITVIDTMRTGSDYWRPGKLVTDVANILRANGVATVTYARRDELCPSKELLTKFRETPSMTFGQYAEAYAAEMKKGGTALAAEMVVTCLSKEATLPLFLCTDPYIPGYLPESDRGKAYAKRGYPVALREMGCHRFILAEELAGYFKGLGITTNIIQADPSYGRCLTR
jgi:hypothetical protein